MLERYFYKQGDYSSLVISAQLPGYKLVTHENSRLCNNWIFCFFFVFRKKYQKIHGHQPPTCCLHAELEIQAICRSWEIVFMKKIEFLVFFGKYRKLRRTLDEHWPPAIFCLRAQFDIHVFRRPGEIVVAKKSPSQLASHPIINHIWHLRPWTIIRNMARVRPHHAQSTLSKWLTYLKPKVLPEPQGPIWRRWSPFQ